MDLLIEYADNQGNSATFKRLGFIMEMAFPSEKKTIQTCHNKIKSGYSQLDPSIHGEELFTRWNLWVPKNWKKGIPN